MYIKHLEDHCLSNKNIVDTKEGILAGFRISGTPYLIIDSEKKWGRVGNWRSSLGLAYPHFHEDVSVSVPFV